MADIPLSRIQELTEFARANNLTRIECDGIKLEFGPVVQAQAPRDEEQMLLLQKALAHDELTPEQALFNSAPTYASLDEIKSMMRGMGMQSPAGEE